ncbi:MAG: DUF433 domain-containing protein [Limisphaerales bacterium]
MIATSYRHIVRRAGVRSGHAIVEGTRVGVHDVVALIKTGASVDAVVASLPRLTRAQVYECLAYYEDHRAELDPLVAGQIEHLDGSGRGARIEDGGSRVDDGGRRTERRGWKIDAGRRTTEVWKRGEPRTSNVEH